MTHNDSILSGTVQLLVQLGSPKSSLKKIPEKKFEKKKSRTWIWLDKAITSFFQHFIFFYRERCNILGENFFYDPENFSGVTPTNFVSPFLGRKKILTPRVFLWVTFRSSILRVSFNSAKQKIFQSSFSR